MALPGAVYRKDCKEGLRGKQDGGWTGEEGWLDQSCRCKQEKAAQNGDKKGLFETT